ncbi:MAG: metalloregulator ArsR/SmtB family transcription factor [Nocardioides sp.]|uniref:ArsR/SmtB family transcription factor n=1 Tax=Nocardioides sp. TaxID=35761 RepID=UPI0039E58E6F
MAGSREDPGGRRDLDARYRAVGELFSALAAPVRAAIVHRLTVREHSVTELVEELGISQPLVSQHLRTLRGAGLVQADRNGRVLVYRLVDEHVAHIFLDAYRHSREGREGD